MDDWDPESSVTIADRVGIAIVDLKVPQSQHVSAKDRLDIRVRCWAGEGPPAIPLHCGSLSTRTWDDVAIALRTDFRPFAVAHRASDWAKTIVEAATTTSSFPSRGCRWAEVGGCEFAPRYLGRVESRVKGRRDLVACLRGNGADAHRHVQVSWRTDRDRSGFDGACGPAPKAFQSAFAIAFAPPDSVRALSAGEGRWFEWYL